MTIYPHAKAQNSRIATAYRTYITQREKIKDFHDQDLHDQDFQNQDFHHVADLAFRRRARLWKASTLRVNRDYLNNQILPVLSKLLGHSTLAMTMRYTHLATRDIEAAAERVGARISAMLDGGMDGG